MTEIIEAGIGLLELIFCLFLLIRIPAYAVWCGLLAVVASVFVAGEARQHDCTSEQAWACVLCVFALYVIGGSLLVMQKKHAADAEYAAHARRQKASAAYALGRFAQESEALPRIIRKEKALASGQLGDITPAMVVHADAVTLIRMVVLPKDEVRSGDAERLKLLREGVGLWKLAHANIPDVIEWIECAETGSLLSLQMLTDAESREREELRDLMTAFCLELAAEGGGEGNLGDGEPGDANRTEAAEAVLEFIRGTAQTEAEILQDHHQQIATAAEDLLNLTNEACRSILGVAEGCSPDELKAAYHAKVRQWHPDQLEHMAPELREYANQELARINAAYEELTTRA